MLKLIARDGAFSAISFPIPASIFHFIWGIHIAFKASVSRVYVY